MSSHHPKTRQTLDDYKIIYWAAINGKKIGLSKNDLKNSVDVLWEGPLGLVVLWGRGGRGY